MAAAETQQHTCDVEGCGKSFTTVQALGTHRWRSHRIRGASKEAGRRAARKEPPHTPPQRVPVLSGRQAASLQRVPLGVSPFMARTRELLEDMTEPLRQQREAIQRRLDDLETEQRELREARQQINTVLARLDPSEAAKHGKPGPKPKPKTNAEAVADANAARAQRQLMEKAEAVRAIITSDPRWHEPFTSNRVAQALTDVVPRGLSTKSARAVLEMLRDDGVVRHHRVVKGGGMAFKLVTSMNGGGEDD